MIIFLHGLDTYRSREKLNEIIARFKEVHKRGLNLKYFDLGEKNFEDFKEAFRTSSMFKEKKFFILENAFTNEDFKERFLALKKDFLNSQDIILFYEPRTPPQDRFFIFLKKHARSQEFQPLSYQKLRDWIKNEFENFGMKIREKALEKLIEFCGSDLWRLSNEIKKLVAFKIKQESLKIIEKEDIELLVKPRMETDIFETIDSICEKNKKKGLSLIKKRLERGDSPHYLISMLNYQFRNLLLIKDLIERGKSYGEILRSIKLHPYLIKKSYFQAQKFTLSKLREIYKLLFQIDWKIKTGKIDPETGLIFLVSKI